MMANDTTYTLSMQEPSSSGSKKQHTSRKHHRRGGQRNDDDDPSDCAGSLSYSAASSVASSAAGESTDSSFADIMRVLDLQDSSELAALMKKEGVVDPRHKKALAASNNSVASSLNYSTDGESALGGEHLLQTITGQPSDSYGPDGGGLSDMGDNILFAPAEPADMKRKSSKSRTPKTKNSSGGSSRTTTSRTSSSSSRSSVPSKTPEEPALVAKSPAVKPASVQAPVVKSQASKPSAVQTPAVKTPASKPLAVQAAPVVKNPASKPSAVQTNPVPASPPPPKPPKGRSDCDDEVWYAKWWMCGFTDAFRDLVPKR